MKKNYLLMLFILFSFLTGNAQKRIQFRYDAAGNQIKRVVLDFISARVAADSIPKTLETITNKDYINDGVLKDIAYYPNPVKQELYLKWKNTDEKIIVGFALYNINGQLVRNIEKLGKTESEIISFHNLAEGIYSLLVNYQSGKIETFKIIKN